MKIRSLLLISILSLSATAFADNRHVQAADDTSKEAGKSASLSENKAMVPGFCEVEIINDSYENLTVYGTWENNVVMEPFNFYRYEYPHYISLYYRDADGISRCHNTMFITIDTFSHFRVYSGYTWVGTTVRIIPLLKQAQGQADKVKAVVEKKK